MGKTRSAASAPILRKGVTYPELTPTQLFDARLKPATLKMYEGLVANLVQEGYSPDYEGLEGRICDGRPITSGQLRNTINAVHHYRNRLFRGDKHAAANQTQPLSAREVKHLRGLVAGRDKYGRRHLGVTEQKKRGAITKEMFDELMEWMEKQEDHGWGCDTDYRNALRICWGTGLRTCQMNQIHWSDFKKGPKGEWFLHAEKIHDPCECNQSTAPAGLAIRIDRSIYKLVEYQVKIHAEDKSARVAPFWQGLRVNKWIQTAASALGWLDEALVKFDGVHCLRHGLATETYAVTGDYVIVQNILGHNSPGVSRGYATPNELRSAMHERRVARQELALQQRMGQQHITFY